MPTIIASSRFPNKAKLLDQVRDVIRRKHYSIRTEQAYLDWIKRFIIYHNKRHPAETAEEEVARFLTHLARDRDVAPSTQNQHVKASLTCQEQVKSRCCSTFTYYVPSLIWDFTLAIQRILSGGCGRIKEAGRRRLRIADLGS